jgi:hypothetical protein
MNDKNLEDTKNNTFGSNQNLNPSTKKAHYVKCNTCTHTHKKGDDYPCRGCCNYDLWELTGSPPWPNLPKTVALWYIANDALQPK